MGQLPLGEQVAVEGVDQGGGGECPGYLGDDEGHHLALVKAAEGHQCQGHGRVEVGTGDATGDIDGDGDTQAPGNGDFPLPEVGASQHQGGHAADTEEDQQAGADKLGEALAKQGIGSLYAHSCYSLYPPTVGLMFRFVIFHSHSLRPKTFLLVF